VIAVCQSNKEPSGERKAGTVITAFAWFGGITKKTVSEV